MQANCPSSRSGGRGGSLTAPSSTSRLATCATEEAGPTNKPPGDATTTIQPAQNGLKGGMMTEPVKRRKKPDSDDPAKEQRIAEVRRMLEGKQRPDPSSR